MVAAVICDLCKPSLFGGAPTHHYGYEVGHTVEGLLGGWKCACLCSTETDVSRDHVSRDPEPPATTTVGPK